MQSRFAGNPIKETESTNRFSNQHTHNYGIAIFSFWFCLEIYRFFPLSYAILCSFQAQQKFCVAFGIKGIFNFEEMRKSTIIENTENKKKDNIKAWQIIFKSFFLAFLIVTIYFFLPL